MGIILIIASIVYLVMGIVTRGGGGPAVYGSLVLSALLVLLLAAAAAFLLRKPAAGAVAVDGAVQTYIPPTVGGAGILNALKEELFALESDKVAGKISPAEYAELKAAMEKILKRALNRK